MITVQSDPQAYPPCGAVFNDNIECSVDGCECVRATIIALEDQHSNHEVAVSISAMYQTTEIRQHGFDGHDAAFAEFDTLTAEGNATPTQLSEFVTAHPCAIHYALVFSGLKKYA